MFGLKKQKPPMALFVCAVAPVLAFSVLAQDGPPPAQVRVTTAEERLMAPQMDVSGTVISLNDSQISAEVEGPLLWIAEVGTKVAAGDVIARIDERLLRVAFDQATARLKRLQADMVFRTQDVARFEELAAGDNASRARLQEVIAGRDMLVHDISDAEADVDRAKGDLARSAIKAPFPGHVASRLANKGEYLTVGEEVLRLVDTQNMEVVIPAPLAIARYLKAGTEVTVHEAAGTHMLPIRTVVPVGDSISRMVEVRLSAPAEDWVVGTPVKVSLPKSDAVRAVAVPRDALILKGGSVFVYKIDDDMTAQQIRAEVAATVGLWVSLKNGIEAGDKVVIRGAERLQPGQAVSIDNSQIVATQ